MNEPAPSCSSCCNLNDTEVQKRRLLGYASLLAAFALVVLSKLQRLPEWVQILPAIPFFVAYLNLFQVRSRTCVALAFMERDLSNGQLQATPDRATSRRLKKRSAKMIASALVLALVSAAICWKL